MLRLLQTTEHYCHRRYDPSRAPSISQMCRTYCDVTMQVWTALYACGTRTWLANQPECCEVTPPPSSTCSSLKKRSESSVFPPTSASRLESNSTTCDENIKNGDFCADLGHRGSTLFSDSSTERPQNPRRSPSVSLLERLQNTRHCH